MKTKLISFLKFSLIASALVGLVYVTGCDSDDDPEVNPFVGNYTFSTATYLGFATPTGIEADTAFVIVPTGVAEPPTTTLAFPPGSDIGSIVSQVVYGIIDCSSDEQVRIELRADFALWYTCADESAEAELAGTWTVNETAGTLSLNIDSEAIGQLSIVLNDVDLSNNILSGTIVGFPIPKDATADPLLSPANLQIIAFEAEFIKVN